MAMYQDLGHFYWSGTGGGEYASYEASGGDYYEITDWGDPWNSEYYELMQYTYSDMTMTFSVTEDIKLIGFGDLGFKLDGGDAAALSSIEDGLVLSAGTYTLQVSDFGFGINDSNWSNFSWTDDNGDYYWDFSGHI